MDGYIHSYESLAAVDGVGVRYGVFLSGCPLRCVYCHNPDTWDVASGKPTSPEALVAKLRRYKPYFGKDGGVTFSGGEPLVQAEFLRDTVPLLQAAGIPYILDTSGAIPLSDTVRSVLSHAQGVLLDVKFWDDASYRTYTGRGIGGVLDTLAYLDAIDKDTTVRTVVVPGINDSEQTMDRYAKLVRPYRCVRCYELLPFHTMGFHKYEKLGIQNPLASTAALDQERLDRLQRHIDTRIHLQQS